MLNVWWASCRTTKAAGTKTDPNPSLPFSARISPNVIRLDAVEPNETVGPSCLVWLRKTSYEPTSHYADRWVILIEWRPHAAVRPYFPWSAGSGPSSGHCAQGILHIQSHSGVSLDGEGVPPDFTARECEIINSEEICIFARDGSCDASAASSFELNDVMTRTGLWPSFCSLFLVRLLRFRRPIDRW